MCISNWSILKFCFVLSSDSALAQDTIHFAIIQIYVKLSRCLRYCQQWLWALAINDFSSIRTSKIIFRQSLKIYVDTPKWMQITYLSTTLQFRIFKILFWDYGIIIQFSLSLSSSKLYTKNFRKPKNLENGRKRLPQGEHIYWLSNTKLQFSWWCTSLTGTFCSLGSFVCFHSYSCAFFFLFVPYLDMICPHANPWYSQIYFM